MPEEPLYFPLKPDESGIDLSKVPYPCADGVVDRIPSCKTDNRLATGIWEGDTRLACRLVSGWSGALTAPAGASRIGDGYNRKDDTGSGSGGQCGSMDWRVNPTRLQDGGNAACDTSHLSLRCTCPETDPGEARARVDVYGVARDAGPCAASRGELVENASDGYTTPEPGAETCPDGSCTGGRKCVSGQCAFGGVNYYSGTHVRDMKPTSTEGGPWDGKCFGCCHEPSKFRNNPFTDEPRQGRLATGGPLVLAGCRAETGITCTAQDNRDSEKIHNVWICKMRGAEFDAEDDIRWEGNEQGEGPRWNSVGNRGCIRDASGDDGVGLNEDRPWTHRIEKIRFCKQEEMLYTVHKPKPS